jgi:hypothetical protein
VIDQLSPDGPAGAVVGGGSGTVVVTGTVVVGAVVTGTVVGIVVTSGVVVVGLVVDGNVVVAGGTMVVAGVELVATSSSLPPIQTAKPINKTSIATPPIAVRIQGVRPRGDGGFGLDPLEFGWLMAPP